MGVSSSDYPSGPNKILYKAKNFVTGLTVTCFVYNKHMEKSEEITLTELEHGLYFFDFDFRQFEVYVAIFFENGEAVVINSFRTRGI